MSVPHYDILRTNPQTLAKLMRREKPAPAWQEDDFAAILRHQLASSMVEDLRAAGLSARALPQCKPPIRVFMDLFSHPCPPLAYLEITKLFAKRYLDRTDGALPREVATVLYYGSIVVARVRLRKRISTLDDAAIRSGIEWILCQKWIGTSLIKLFHQALPSLPDRQPRCSG